MKTKRFFFVLAASAMLATTAGFTTACSTEDNNPVEPEVKDTYPIAIDEKHFPDAAFRTLLIQNYRWAADGVLTEDEAMKVEIIFLTTDGSVSIKSLKGIEWFPNLAHLSCNNQKLTEVDVSKNKELDILELDDNELTSIDLTENPNLMTLSLKGNKLKSIDLSKNRFLSEVILGNNELESLDLSKNPEITLLWVANNQLTSLDLTGLDLYMVVIHSNSIRGEAMDVLIASLPTGTNNQLIGIDTSDPNERNVITKAQVEAAMAKGWVITDWATPGSYPGSE